MFSEKNRNLPTENQYGSVHEVLHVVDLFEKSWEFKAFLQKNFQQNIHLLYMQLVVYFFCSEIGILDIDFKKGYYITSESRLSESRFTYRYSSLQICSLEHSISSFRRKRLESQSDPREPYVTERLIAHRRLRR